MLQKLALGFLFFLAGLPARMKSILFGGWVERVSYARRAHSRGLLPRGEPQSTTQTTHLQTWAESRSHAKESDHEQQKGGHKLLEVMGVSVPLTGW